MTFWPEQNVVADPAVNTGVLGIGLTNTAIELDTCEVHPNAYARTLNTPLPFTTKVFPFWPFDHNLFPVPLLVNTTLSPEQNVVDEPAVMTGADGVAFTVTGIEFETIDEQPFDTT